MCLRTSRQSSSLIKQESDLEWKLIVNNGNLAVKSADNQLKTCLELFAEHDRPQRSRKKINNRLFTERVFGRTHLFFRAVFMRRENL